MPILDLYNNSERRRNLAHFAALASLAAVDGAINPPEKEVIDSFARKLDITEAEYKEVMKKENKYPIEAAFELDKRYERLFDFFRIIFSDNSIEEKEMVLVKKYALGIGFTAEQVDAVVNKSVVIFSGKIPFEDYLVLMKRK